jgi:hypothetical protein
MKYPWTLLFLNLNRVCICRGMLVRAHMNKMRPVARQLLDILQSRPTATEVAISRNGMFSGQVMLPNSSRNSFMLNKSSAAHAAHASSGELAHDS